MAVKNTIPQCKDRPFRVVQIQNEGLAKGHDTLEMAEVDAKKRNSRAEAMGIQARYKAIAKPE